MNNDHPPARKSSKWQWRSQDIADARAQHGHTTFVRYSARSAEVFRGVWGMLSQKIFGILQPPRSVLRLYCSKLARTVSVRES